MAKGSALCVSSFLADNTHNLMDIETTGCNDADHSTLVFRPPGDVCGSTGNIMIRSGSAITGPVPLQPGVSEPDCLVIERSYLKKSLGYSSDVFSILL